jgi:uncharacterized protein
LSRDGDGGPAQQPAGPVPVRRWRSLAIVAAVLAVALAGGIAVFAPDWLAGWTEPPPDNAPHAPPQDPMGRFVAAVLGAAEDRWREILAREGKSWRPARLVLFTRRTHSGCGRVKSETGPFYCPDDERIYLDTAFFREIEARFHGCEGKACQFAEAFIIAHEVGHHVQKIIGDMDRAVSIQHGLPEAAANKVQVKVELQADCFAGIWAYHAQAKWDFLEPGDVEAVLSTIAATGDDVLQRQEEGEVMPDTFTHGTSEQRRRWFLRGFNSGAMADCNTLDAAEP